MEERTITENAVKSIRYYEKSLEDNNTSIEKEFNRMINKYNNELSMLKSDSKNNSTQIENLNELISSLEESKMNYNNFNYEDYENNYRPMAVYILPDASATLLALHAAIVAYWSNNGYDLAAELLQHMRYNSNINDSYKPINSNIIKNTSKYQEILNSSNSIDDITFEKGITVESIDAFYALHAVRYNKTPNNSGIVISDRYDFAFDEHYDDFLTQTAVNSMYTLQSRGYLVPFYVIIETSENSSPTTYNGGSSINFDSYTRYIERYGIIGCGDELKYTITVSSSGYRTIQTFGPDDTYLRLYNEFGTLLYSNDDSGYKLNGLLNYYFAQGNTYILSVKMYSTGTVGNIRVGFSPINETNYDDIQKITITTGLFYDTYKDIAITSQSGYTNAFTLEQNQDRNFTIETKKYGSSYVDTMLFIIDPRRSNYYDGTTKYPMYLSNDDGGGNLQAQIDITTEFFSKNTPFLIISALYNLNNTGSYYLSITGLDISHLIIL